jgi:hypothetical protein
MTAYELSILLYYVYATTDHPDCAIKAAPWPPAVERLLREALMEVTNATGLGEQQYRLAPRGVALADGLQRVPLPIQQWMVPVLKD